MSERSARIGAREQKVQDVLHNYDAGDPRPPCPDSPLLIVRSLRSLCSYIVPPLLEYMDR